jgi:hypothetical protein
LSFVFGDASSFFGSATPSFATLFSSIGKKVYKK